MTNRFTVIGVPALLGLFAAAIGSSGSLAGAARLSPIEQAPGATGGGGAVIGTVKFLETPPKPERLKVDKNNNICGLTKVSEGFIVSPETKGLKNVVLTVVGVRGTSAAPSKPLPALTQDKCVYGPHVQTATVGQKLQITNHDDVLHNIHAYGANQDTLFNVAQPIKNMSFGMALEREGVVTVKCDVHSWMQAYIVVAPHPYTAVTDENGAYRIDGVPPGSYKLQAWHEALGTLNKDLTVVQGRDTTVTFDVGK